MFLYYPQWQSGAPNDSIFHGARILHRKLQDDFGMKFTEIEVETKQPDDPRNHQSPNQIRQGAALVSNYNTVQKTLDQHHPASIFTLGGDCGTDLSLISWLNRKYSDEFAVIWFDAHPDMNSITTSPSGRFDGMVLRHLIDGLDIQQRNTFPALQSQQVILAGTRSFDVPETEFIAECNITLVTCDELHALGAKILIDHLRKQGYRRCYIHIDTDVIDPKEFPCGTSLTADGISIQTLSHIIKNLHSCEDVEIMGGCLVEVTDDVQNHPHLENAMCELFRSLSGYDR